MDIDIDSGSITYHQEADSNSEGHHFLDVLIQDAGGGKYFVIKTDRWAFDTIDDLVVLLRKAGEKFDMEFDNPWHENTKESDKAMMRILDTYKKEPEVMNDANEYWDAIYFRFGFKYGWTVGTVNSRLEPEICREGQRTGIRERKNYEGDINE